jgi:hypothetical protein
VDVLGARTHSNEASWNSPQHRELLQEPHGQRKALEAAFETQGRADETLVREELKSLNHSHWKLAALLDLTKFVFARRAI